MKKTFFIRKPFYVLLMPLFMAVLCEKQNDVTCGFEDFDGFNISVENTQLSYNVDETIWLDAVASSILENECESNETEIVTDAELFRDSLIAIKLVDSDTDIIAEIATFNVMYDTGSEFSFNTCDEAINVVPVISNDDLEYSFRLGLSFSTPGDYCVVIGRRVTTTFNNSTNVNLEVYEPYNNGNNTIKFDSCGDIYTRNLDAGVYFFTIE